MILVQFKAEDLRSMVAELVGDVNVESSALFYDDYTTKAFADHFVLGGSVLGVSGVVVVEK